MPYQMDAAPWLYKWDMIGLDKIGYLQVGYDKEQKNVQVNILMINISVVSKINPELKMKLSVYCVLIHLLVDLYLAAIKLFF